MHMTAFFDGVVEKLGFMGDDHVGDVQVLEDVDEAVPGGLVEAGGGLIQQEQLRLHGQDGGQGHQLFLPPESL